MASDGVENQSELPQNPRSMVIKGGVFANFRRVSRRAEWGHDGTQAEVCEAYDKVFVVMGAHRVKKREASLPEALFWR
ncbi:hypothetical protein [Limnohabitans sp. Rim8]|jgi:hypothetical protein|uniref:hypothetical protein n=1 Tax=Limnohabitans sp. Rim8 TaxID=1100718 RepID=UPI0025EC80AF|nr:hypothetical protein [Limnohabitans sp. Rim8]